MTLAQFIAKYNGQSVDFDGIYSYQCKDLFSYFNRDVVGNQTYIYGNAYEMFDNVPDNLYVKVINTSSFVPQKGDWCIWKQEYGGWGHIGMVISANVNTMDIMSQNSEGNQNPVNIKEYNYNKVKGFIRMIGGNMGKIVWNGDVAVIFTDGQVREMSRDFLQKERGATGNESWGFVQECEKYAREKYASDKTAIENLVQGSKDKVTEINLLKKKNEAQLAEYNKQVIKNNELIEMDKNLRDEIVDLRLELSECKAKLAEKPTGEQPCTFIEWIKQLFNRKD